MAGENEYGIVVGVDATGAQKGSQVFKRSLSDIAASAGKIVQHTSRATKGFETLGKGVEKVGQKAGSDFRKAAQSVTNSSDRIATQTTKAATSIQNFANTTTSSAAQIRSQMQGMAGGFTASTTSIQRQVKATSNSFAGLGTVISSVKTMLLGFAAGFTLRAAIGMIAGFEASMSRIQSLLGSDATPAAIAKITAAARELGATTVYSASQAAEGMTELIKAGMSTEQAMAAGRATLNLAAADNLTLAESASYTANILATFGMAAERAGEAADVLAHAANATQTDVRGVASAMAYVGPLASTLGTSFQDTAAAVGSLSNAGIDATMAGTSLRQVMAGLLTPTDKSAKAMESMGLNVRDLQQVMGTEGGLVKMVEQFADAQERMGNKAEFAARVMEVLGDRGGPALLALIGQLPGLRELTAQMGEVEGTAQRMADVMTDNLKGDLAEVESAVEELVLQVGEGGLLPSLRSAAQGIGAFARGLAGLGEDIDKATGLMTTMNKVGGFLRENMELIKDGLIVLASVFVGRWVAALALGIKTKIAARMEMVRYQMALASMAGVSRTAAAATTMMTTAATGLRAVMALLGGPVGVILIAATALMTFSGNADAARVSAEDLGTQIDSLKQKFISAGEEQRKFFLMQATEAQNTAQTQITAIEQKLAASKRAEAELARLQAAPIPLGKGAQEMRGGQMALAQSQILGDTETQGLRAEQEALRSTIVKTNMAMLEMQAIADGTHVGLGAVAATTKEATATTATLGDATELTKEQIRAAEQAAKAFASALSSLVGTHAPLVALEHKHQQELTTLNTALAMTEAQLKEHGLTHDIVRQMIDASTEAYAKQRAELDPMAVKYKDLVEAMRAAAKQARPLEAATKEYNDEMARTNALLAEGDDAIARAQTTREELLQFQRDAAANYAKTTEEILRNRKEADPWAKAWESSIKRLDGLFVDLWKSAFDGFKGFKDKLVDTFKSMLAELANAAMTRAITGWFSKFLGEPGGGNGAGAIVQAGVGLLAGNSGSGTQVSNGAGGTTQVAQAVIGASGGGGGGNNMSVYSTVGTWIAKGMAKYGATIANGAAAASPYVAGAAAVAGGYYGLTQRGQSTGDLGSLAAGASYAAAGYVGATVAMGAITGAAGAAGAGATAAGVGSAAAGGAMGAASAIPIVGWILAALALIDGLSGGKLFGTRFAPDATTTTLGIGAEGGSASATLTEVRNRSMFRGRKWRERDIAAGPEAMKAADDLYNSISEVMKGAADALNVNVPPVIDGAIKVITDLDKKGRVKGTKYQVVAGGSTRDVENVEEGVRWLSAEALWRVIEESFPKADAFRRLWDNSLEGLEQGIEQLMNLLVVVRANPIEDAEKAWATQQRTGVENYRKQQEEYIKLLATFDGGMASMQALAAATGQLKNAQFELAMAYKEVAQYGSTAFQGTAQNIRESLMGTEELYDLRQSQIQQLMEQMGSETDPARLQALVDEINRLTADAYNMLDGDQQSAMAQDFIDFLTEAENLLLERVGIGQDQLSEDSAAVTDLASLKMNEAADRQLEAARLFDEAVRRFNGGSVGGGGGGPGGRNPTTNELMVT